MSNYTKIVLNGAMWSFLQTITERIIQFVVFFFVAKQLGPHDFGVATIVIAPAAIFIATLEGITAAIVQSSQVEESDYDGFFIIGIFWGAVFSLLILLSGPVLAFATNEHLVRELVPYCAVVPIISALGAVPEGRVARAFQFKLLAVRRSVGILVGGAVCIAMATHGFGAWSLIAQTVSVAMANTATVLVGARWLPNIQSGVNHFRRVLRASHYFMGSNALSQGTVRIGDIVVGIIAGPAAAGIFRFSRTVVDLVTSVIFTPIARVLGPVFGRMSNEPMRLVRSTFSVINGAIALFGIAAIGMIFNSDLPALFIGNKWNGLGSSLKALAASLPSLAVVMPLQMLLSSSGRQKANFLFNLSQLVLNCVFIGLGSYLGGALGANIGFAARSYFAVGIMVAVARYREPLLDTEKWTEIWLSLVWLFSVVVLGLFYQQTLGMNFGPTSALLVSILASGIFTVAVIKVNSSLRFLLQGLYRRYLSRA